MTPDIAARALLAMCTPFGWWLWLTPAAYRSAS